MYVVHEITLSDSFWIWIVWFQPKQDSDRISLLKNRTGLDSKNHYLIISDALPIWPGAQQWWPPIERQWARWQISTWRTLSHQC